MKANELNTIEDITIFMLSLENALQFFNKKYNFETEKIGTPGEKKLYQSILKTWDTLKKKRDRLKTENFKKNQQ